MNLEINPLSEGQHFLQSLWPIVQLIWCRNKRSVLLMDQQNSILLSFGGHHCSPVMSVNGKIRYWVPFTLNYIHPWAVRWLTPLYQLCLCIWGCILEKLFTFQKLIPKPFPSQASKVSHMNSTVSCSWNLYVSCWNIELEWMLEPNLFGSGVVSKHSSYGWSQTFFSIPKNRTN